MQPRSLFGLRPPYGTPGIGDDPQGMGVPGMGMSPPPEPFVFGKGGARYTPEQVAQMREMAQAEIADAGSYAPVQSWTQGLDRALGAITGGIRLRKADKADAAIQAESDAVTQALLADPSKEHVLQVLGNARAPKGAQSVAELLAKPMFAKPAEPPEIVQLAAIANDPTQPDHIRAAARDRVTALNDPLVNMPLPGGRTFVGPRSEVVPTLGGGGQASGVPQTTAPPAEAIAELKADPTGAAEFDEMFGAGAAARVLGGGTGNGVGGFPGG